LLDLEVALLWFESLSGARMAVRKLDDESSLLGLAKDGSKTGLGILDMLGDSNVDVRTGENRTLSAARVPETSSGDGDGRLVAN
jgi:hypothetical protein